MREQLHKKTRTSLLYMLAVIQTLALFAPLSSQVFAQDASLPNDATTQAVPVADTTSSTTPPKEVRRPTGSAAHTFVYNFETGLWENEYYTWNPNTSVRSAKFTPEHTYNESSGLWEVREWVYVASEGVYRYRVTSTYAPTPPPTTKTEPEPTPIASPPIDSNTSDRLLTNQDTMPNILVSSTNNVPENDISLFPSTQNNVDLSVSASLTTNLDSTATSGDASVLQNTTAGNATSGDAYAMANIINMVQSAWSSEGIQPNIFSTDIQGNYYGDIVLSPTQITAQSNPCNCGDLEIHSTTNGTIANNVNLLAQTGNASVVSNTNAGDATSGNATAVANIINMINSSIVSGQSFLGIINVHGDLEGDVLMPEDILKELVASNVPRTQLSLDADSIVNLEDNQTITNNITTTATSGDATVSNNTHGGNATSGNTQTNVTIFNLTGRQVIGSNALLVFVNVSGEWVGFITNAPNGSTAALLGDDITTVSSCPNCMNGESNAENNAEITNTVSVTAQTGNAIVSNNTRGGNATSGDAEATANIGNITNSTFSLSSWFGILFINVFGNWYGSFGTDTAYGDRDNLGQTPATGSYTLPIIGKPEAKPVPPPEMKVFSANFAVDEEGNEVLVAATEQLPAPPSDSAESVLAQTASVLGNDATHNFSPLLLILASAAAFVVIMHGDSLKAIALRTRQF